jgi:integrase
MATANFYLKDSTSINETLIYLFFHYNGKRMKFSTGEKIAPKNWNPENQRVKKSFPGSPELNGYLEKVIEEVQKIYRTANSNDIDYSIDELREKLNNKLNRKKIIQKEFFEYLDEFIDVNKNFKKPNTIKKYVTLRNHLEKFEKEKKFKVKFDTINSRFYELYNCFSIVELNQLNNTFSKYIKVLKTFLNWATERGYNTNTKFIKFKTPVDESDNISLTQEELDKLYEFDFSNDKKLGQLRDSFCFGCYTSLRFSDISRVRKINIKGDNIQIKSLKTKSNLDIPLNVFAKEILIKYDYKIPVISNQKTNKYLKEIGKIVGIDEPILKTQYKGVEEIQKDAPKYNFISTHTARRTFVTLSLEKGMRAETVMKISDHKDHKTFEKYIKITSKIKSIEMHAAWNRERKLQVV